MAKDDKRAQDLKTEWEYPYNQVTQTLGGHEVHYNSTPDKESYRHYTPGGTFTEIDKSGRKVEFVADNHFRVFANGSSQTNEGVLDRLTLGGSRINDIGSVAREIAGDYTQGVHGQSIKAAKGTTFHYNDGNHEIGSDGQHLVDANDGAMASFSAEDAMLGYGKSLYNMIQGDHGNFAQGNMDFKSVKKARFAADDNLTVYSKQDIKIGSQDTGGTANSQNITISAQTKITLQVGQSKIVIESGGITITASKIDFKKA